MVYFFSEPEVSKAIVVRAEDQRKLSIPSLQGMGAVYHLLSHDLNRKIEFIKITMEPRIEEEGGLVTHQGEECGYVVSGTLVVRIQGETHVLNAGDSIYYDSSLPHRFFNPGKATCISVWAMTPPTF
ncbi:MAG: HTH-type transcriptional regulator PuuR [Syntrophomonadaceae bacterium]|nr:HTH-type transcriptional regulator PuuR [Bacillota bacterium]